MINNIEREFGWDDEISNDSGEFIIIPEGDYDFEITSMERGRHAGSEKLPPCNKATVTFCIIDPVSFKKVYVLKDYFLHSKCEGFLCEFFIGIGQRKHGESYRMNWSKVVGIKGRCKIVNQTVTSKTGNEYIKNEIKKIYEPEEEELPQVAPWPPPTNYKAGAF